MSEKNLSNEELASISGAGPKPGTSAPITAADKLAKQSKDEVDKASLGTISGGLGVNTQQGDWNVAPAHVAGRSGPDEVDRGDLGRVAGGVGVSTQQGDWNVAHTSGTTGRAGRDELDQTDVGRISGGAVRTDANPMTAGERGIDLGDDIVDGGGQKGAQAKGR